MSTNKKWLWWLVGSAWALLLLGLGVWSAMHSPATVRDQSPISSGKATIDRVVGEVRGDLPDRWRFDDDGYHENPCRITPMRDGAAATRTLTLSGPEGTEAEALTKLAAGFGDVRLRPAEGTPEGFYVDAGNFVAVRAQVNGPGIVVLELKTGCRPAD